MTTLCFKQTKITFVIHRKSCMTDMVTIDYNCTVKCSMNILQSFFCVPQKKTSPDESEWKNTEFHIWVNYFFKPNLKSLSNSHGFHYIMFFHLILYFIILQHGCCEFGHVCLCGLYTVMSSTYRIRGVDIWKNDWENLIPSGTWRLDEGARVETENATFAFKKVTFAMLVWTSRNERRDRCWDSPYSSRWQDDNNENVKAKSKTANQITHKHTHAPKRGRCPK